MVVIHKLMEWYLGEEVERVRMINDQRYEEIGMSQSRCV